MKEMIEKFDMWLRTNRSSFYSSLYPGNTREEITSLKKEIGLEIPDEFLQFYNWHNGQDYSKPYTEWFIAGWYFLPINNIISIFNTLSELNREGDFAESNWWRDSWIPFLANDGADVICLDLEGSFGGRKGQIIRFLHDDPIRRIIHQSFYKWVETLVGAVEEGYQIYEDEFGERSALEKASYDLFYKKINPGYPIDEYAS